MSKLRECPFCNQPAEIEDPDGSYQRGIGFRIQCEPCNMSMWSFAGERPDELIGRWNVGIVSLLESYDKAGEVVLKHVAEIKRLAAINAELLAACELCWEEGPHKGWMSRDCFEKLEAVIEKAKQ